MAHCELILGGARSGKSALAQRRADAHAHHSTLSATRKVIYIATATAGDSEMATRIEHHKANRPNHWQIIEEPVYLANAIAQWDTADSILLVDCLTLWLTNLLCSDKPALLEQEKEALLHSLVSVKGNVILVSNETGLGVIPTDPLSRKFIDEAGWLHQKIAQRANRVTYCIAGLEHSLKND